MIVSESFDSALNPTVTLLVPLLSETGGSVARADDPASEAGSLR